MAAVRFRQPSFDILDVQFRLPDARVISCFGYMAKSAISPNHLMPVAGLQDVGHATVAAGRGELRLRSAKRSSPHFYLSNSRRQMLGHKPARLCGKMRRSVNPSYVCRI